MRKKKVRSAFSTLFQPVFEACLFERLNPVVQCCVVKVVVGVEFTEWML